MPLPTRPNTIRIHRIPKPAKGWPNNRPLKWEVVGPGDERQKFTNRKDAIAYRIIRGRAIDQRAAKINFSR